MPPKFSIGRAAVREAGKRLGLKHEVRVQITYYKDPTTHGRYVDLRDGVHRIAVAGDQSFRQASRTLWHELAMRCRRSASAAEQRSTRRSRAS